MAHTEYTRESFTEPLENSETHIEIYLVSLSKKSIFLFLRKNKWVYQEKEWKGKGKVNYISLCLVFGIVIYLPSMNVDSSRPFQQAVIRE